MPKAPLKDNPYGNTFINMEDDGRRFLIVNEGVGNHHKNAIVSAWQLGQGAQIPRMVKLGAILEVDPTQTPNASPSQSGG